VASQEYPGEANPEGVFAGTTNDDDKALDGDRSMAGAWQQIGWSVSTKILPARFTLVHASSISTHPLGIKDD
jgi:hypothetical protein